MMTKEQSGLLIGRTPIQRRSQNPTGSYVELLDETFYRISNCDQISPFLVSLVSSSDHWLFITSCHHDREEKYPKF
jgi:hypothetical protein